MINIISFAKDKPNSTKSVSGGGFSNRTVIKSKLDSHKLWGQTFDGSNDVSGDMSGVGNIIASGDIKTTGNIASASVTANDISSTGVVSGVSGNFETSVTTNDVSATNVNSTNIESSAGKITELSGTNLDFETAILDAIQSSNTKTDYLTVSKKASFMELDIDVIKAVGGQVILTAASGTLDYVTTLDTGDYRCYFKPKDNEKFVVNDFVLCQTFDIDNSKFYWRKVIETGKETITISDVATEYDYIDLSGTDCDEGSDIPEIGDKIAQLGNSSDTTRQSAIIISANQSPDKTVESPSIVQYSGINDYQLSTHKLNQIAKNGNVLKGKFQTSTGADIETLLAAAHGTNRNMLLDANFENVTTRWNGNTFSEISTKVDGTIVVGKDGNNAYQALATDKTTILSQSLTGKLQPSTTYTLSYYYTEDKQGDNSVGLFFSSPIVDTVISTNSITSITSVDYNTFDFNYIANEWSLCYVTFKTLATLPSDYNVIFANWNTTEGNVCKISQPKLEVGTIYTSFTLNEQDLKGGTDNDKLIPVKELAVVDKDGTLGITFTYQIANTSGYYVRFRPSNDTSYTYLSITTNTPTYTNTSYLTNYHLQSDPPQYFLIELVHDGAVLDSRLVNVIFSAGATLNVTDSINTTVQSNYSELSGKITTNTNNLSTLTQTSDSINTRVERIETSFVSNDALTTEVSSQIDQRADNISLLVSEKVGDKLKNTGIDIKSGQINLNSDNTNINGQLNVTDSDAGLNILDDKGKTTVQVVGGTIQENAGQTVNRQKSSTRYSSWVFDTETSGTNTKQFLWGEVEMEFSMYAGMSVAIQNFNILNGYIPSLSDGTVVNVDSVVLKYQVLDPNKNTFSTVTIPNTVYDLTMSSNSEGINTNTRGSFRFPVGNIYDSDVSNWIIQNLDTTTKLEGDYTLRFQVYANAYTADGRTGTTIDSANLSVAEKIRITAATTRTIVANDGITTAWNNGYFWANKEQFRLIYGGSVVSAGSGVYGNGHELLVNDTGLWVKPAGQAEQLYDSQSHPTNYDGSLVYGNRPYIPIGGEVVRYIRNTMPSGVHNYQYCDKIVVISGVADGIYYLPMSPTWNSRITVINSSSGNLSVRVGYVKSTEQDVDLEVLAYNNGGGVFDNGNRTGGYQIASNKVVEFVFGGFAGDTDNSGKWYKL